jgi:hypothetical protein
VNRRVRASSSARHGRGRTGALGAHEVAYIPHCARGPDEKPMERSAAKKCYLSPGTRAVERWLCTEKRHFPDSDLDSFRIEFGGRFWCCASAMSSGELLVNKPLIGRTGLHPLGCLRAIRLAWARFKWRIIGRWRSEGEGACSSLFYKSSHLPLRGKLGWMTPRAGVKTTLAMKRAFRGPRSQAGAPFFLIPGLS